MYVRVVAANSCLCEGRDRRAVEPSGTNRLPVARRLPQTHYSLQHSQLDKATADASEFKAGFDKAAADAAEFKAGFDKVTVDAAEFKAGFDKVTADAVEQKAQLDKASADAAEFKAGFDKALADVAEQKAEFDEREEVRAALGTAVWWPGWRRWWWWWQAATALGSRARAICAQNYGMSCPASAHASNGVYTFCCQSARRSCSASTRRRPRLPMRTRRSRTRPPPT